MKFYHEYAQSPEKRSGVMVPLTALPEIFTRPDAGYCTVFRFDQVAALAIRAQGNSQGLSRFPVYSDRLWIDIDRDDVEVAKVYAREVAAQFKAKDYTFSVWFSGGKGYHLCVKIEPMWGLDVPHSQKVYVESLGLKCDYTLYQHGRLLSNPGRLHPKTGIKKHKVMEHEGKTLLTIPMVAAPDRTVIDRSELAQSDIGKLAFSRLGGLLAFPPEAGGRHQALWSAAMQMVEAGMSEEMIVMNLEYVNQFFPDPKPRSEICRAVQQAINQSG